MILDTYRYEKREIECYDYEVFALEEKILFFVNATQDSKVFYMFVVKCSNLEKIQTI